MPGCMDAAHAHLLPALSFISLSCLAAAPPTSTSTPRPFLSLSATIKDSVALNYAVESRIYPEDPHSLFVTLRGGGVSKYNISRPALPVLEGHFNGIAECEGQDRMGDLLVVATLGDKPRSGLTLLNVSNGLSFGPASYISRINISLPGALHVKLYKAPTTQRMYAIMTTGLTQSPSRSSIVAVDVSDPQNPREVASIPTQCECSEGIIVLPKADAVLIGSYCSNTVQIVSLSELDNGNFRVAATKTETYYENMVSGMYNQSYTVCSKGGCNDLLFSATYTDPGGLVIFNASTAVSRAAEDLRVPTELSRYISNSTARANRVHLHPTGIAFLALEKSHGTDARGGVAAINVSDPTEPTLMEAIRTPDASSRTYCIASATTEAETAGDAKKGVLYAFGATAATMWVYTFAL